jgi:N-acetyl-gamma-glutamyl-phosphate reductase
MRRLQAGIVGFRGYSGMELQAILSRHPHVEPVLMEHRQDAAEKPQARSVRGPKRASSNAAAVKEHGLAAVFLATPADVSMELAPGYLASGARVIDLSGAFRLKTVDAYARWYQEPHTQPELLASAVYGLPEFYRESIPAAKLVANPGCYPTAANLALRPLLAAGVVDRSHGVVCDAKSGVSGAGRKPTLKTHFCEVTENFSAYSILGHRHVPEVLMNSGLEEKDFSFTAQLIPVHRGILETIYFRTQSVKSAADLMAIYESAYAGEPFVRLYDAGQTPDLHSVNHTNYCDIGFKYDAATGRAVVVACIDNLVKGAAGQAVQNMNLMLGLAETDGLQ